MFLGLHAPTQGWTDRAKETAENLHSEAFLWLPSEQPSDALRYPDAVHIVRCPNWTTNMLPETYEEVIAPTVRKWINIPRVIFQLGNEPDLEEGHNGELFKLMAYVIRTRWPNIQLANPPLQAEHTYLLKPENIEAADFVACHCYWQINHEDDIWNPNLGKAYGQLLKYDVPIIVTEVNAVPASGDANDTRVDWTERNTQVATWASFANEDGVHSCCFFITDAAPDWAGFDVGPEAATQIRAEYDGNGGDTDSGTDPDEGGTIMVSADEVIAMARTQVDEPYSGVYDQLNGNHPWAYWCLAFVESTHRNLGLTVVPSSNAVSAGRRRDLNPGRAPRGAACFFNETFYYPDGHTGISTGDGQLLGTLTDGRGVGYRTWNETTAGYMGWCYFDGVEADAVDPPPPNWFVQPDNPYQVEGRLEIGIGGGFLRYYNAISIGQEPMVVLGYAKERETSALVTDEDGTARTRTVQRFQRGTLIYQPENEFPWDVVMALESQTVE